jgi:hypothetical protein
MKSACGVFLLTNSIFAAIYQGLDAYVDDLSFDIINDKIVVTVHMMENLLVYCDTTKVEDIGKDVNLYRPSIEEIIDANFFGYSQAGTGTAKVVINKEYEGNTVYVAFCACVDVDTGLILSKEAEAPGYALLETPITPVDFHNLKPMYSYYVSEPFGKLRDKLRVSKRKIM